MKYEYDNPRPVVTVDTVVVSDEPSPRVLLIRRKYDPFAGMWALPGGFIEMNETLEDSARRELREETGIEVGKLVQLGTFGDPGRDPRDRTITVVYLATVDSDRIQPQAGDDASHVAWHSLREVPPMAFDHAIILDHARKALGLQRQ